MSETTHLALPYLAAAQAQKHVTHNEALGRLDVVVQLGVLDAGMTAPPDTPEEGDRHIVAAGASGAWEGHDGEVAAFVDGVWTFAVPGSGWIAFDAASESVLVHAEGSWVAIGSFLGAVARFGVNTAADDSNRLAVRSEAALFEAIEDADGGTGDVRVILSKEAEADTASLILQDGFSGRAEIGLAGDDDLVFKVSDDGTGWTEAIRIDNASGLPAILYDNAASGLAATSLHGAINELASTSAAMRASTREQLSANRTYYVRTDGDDDNDGLSNTSGGAFLTIQKAVDVAATLDLSIYGIVIQVGDGTYSAGAVIGPLVGAGSLTIQGNGTTPANVTVTKAGGNAFEVKNGGVATVRDMKIGTTTSGWCLYAQNGGKLQFANIEFAAAGTGHVAAIDSAAITCIGNYAISGGANFHMYAEVASSIRAAVVTVTLTGTPNFVSAFAFAARTANLMLQVNTYSGSATGTRYSVSQNATIFVGGAGASYLPGNTGGSASTGGQYG